MSYWDTSALAKLFVAEPDSMLFERHAAASAVPAVTAEITVLEMRRVAFRKRTGEWGQTLTFDNSREGGPSWAPLGPNIMEFGPKRARQTLKPDARPA